MSEVKPSESWRALSQWTTARIALGRVGSSLPTPAVLDFAMDHARARDAIHSALEVEQLARQLQAAGLATVHVRSQARDRAEYLRRPDLGRLLMPESAEVLEEDVQPAGRRLTVVIADGLSSLAPMQHALPLLQVLRAGLADWTLDTVVLATQARVALGDDIGSARGAEATLMLIGERPGLKSADSLGAYLTYNPRRGCTDAQRNCVSNIRGGGLSYEQAAFTLLHLLQGARKLGRSGVDLKDDSSTGARSLSA